MATHHTRAVVERQLRGVTTVLAESNFPLTDRVLRQMADLAGADFLLCDPRGKTLASSGPNAAMLAGLAADGQTARSPAQVTLGESIRRGSESYFHSSLQLPGPTRAGRPAVLHILFSQDDYNAAWRSAFFPPLLVGLGTAAALAWVTQVVARRLSRVLNGLGDEVERLASGDFGPAPVPTTNDELKDLVMAVNQTAERLSEYEEETRRTERLRTLAVLGAGLAHEVRNSATGCRMAIDLHAEACGANGVSGESLEVAKRQLVLIEGRLRQFLQLGKDPEPTPTRELELADLVEDAVSLVGPSAKHAGVEVAWSRPAARCPVLADPEQLGQAISNLVINALDAAAKGQADGGGPGYLRVELRPGETACELVVADSGRGPDERVAGRLFDPFVTEKAEGIGLGLAVVRRVLETHGGRVDWRRAAGETQFILRMPSNA